MIRPILNARLDGASTIPATGTLTAASGSTVDLSLATATLPARNIFNISFNGTANVAGDATNTGHFASIPGTGAAGHFVTQNGTAPTVIAGRSAWYSDGSGVPSFKNGTGTAVTLVRSSDIGVSVQAYDADLTTWAGITPGTGVGTGILSRPIFTTTATAAGTTTLTVTSASTQELTGSTTQTVTMPVVTTLVAGWPTLFINKSTGNVTLNSSGGNAIVVLAGGQSVTLVLKSISVDTTAAAWDVVGLSGKPAFAAYCSGSTTVTTGGATKVAFATEDFDISSNYDTTTSRFTAPVAGKYRFNTTIVVSGSLGANAEVYFAKNGTKEKSIYYNVLDPATTHTIGGTTLISLAANDYVEVFAYNDSGVSRTVSAFQAYTQFAGEFVSP